jgi:hypothetical protein
MDPSLPPGGLYRIFEQYDAIKSHGARDDGLPPDDDDPPWEPPPAPAAPPAAKAPPTKVTGFTTPLSQQDDGKVTVDRPGPLQEVLTDATSDRPRGKPPSWKHDRIEQMQEELGRKKTFTYLSRTS